MRNLSIILFLSGLIFSTESLALSEAQESEIQQLLIDLADTNQLVGSHFVALVDKNGLASFATHSRNGTTISKDTQFLIASHTKAMTATLLATLDAANKIDLDKSIHAYDKQLITNKKINTKQITLKNLLTHTAGFTSVQHTFKSAFLGYTDQSDLKQSLNHRILTAPDNRFRYSNTGPIVATMLAESALDSDWHQLMSEYLFDPLEMTNTTTHISAAKQLLPAITTAKDGTIFDYDHHKTDKTMHASGGVASTAGDMAVWLQANINRDYTKFSKKDIFALLHTKQVEQDRNYFTYPRDGYTLGWDIAQYNGEKLLTRFGNYGGYSIHVSFMPEHQLGVIAFTNQDIAYTLPHILANYVYNSALQKSNKLELLQQDSKRLTKSIQSELSAAPAHKQVVSADAVPPNLLGTYSNSDGWPKQKLFTENGQAKVIWGSLKGILLQTEDGYRAHFGALSRKLKFSLQGEGKPSLTNGSLAYTKV
ncbi:serine hydrolase domain-containing protein [Microbulbifer sp. 2201CG32-9]|uniref:serine hydrolase domain-containing protein n=1 Tax=Microbulbifer sp. 2201CG32-9 TaxID=3232309 RepID=UPI00345C2BD8